MREGNKVRIDFVESRLDIKALQLAVMKMRSRLDINLQVARRNIQKSGLRWAFLMRHSLSGLYFLNCDSYVTRPTTAQKPSRATRLTASQAISSRKFFEGWSNRILNNVSQRHSIRFLAQKHEVVLMLNIVVRILLDHLVEDAGEHERDGDRVEVGEEEAEGLPRVQEEPEPEGRRTDQHLDHLPAEST